MQFHNANALGPLNLTSNMQRSKRDEWEGSCLAQSAHKYVKECKRWALSRPTSIYRGGSLKRVVALPRKATDALPASDATRGCHVSRSFELRVIRTHMTDASIATDRRSLATVRRVRRSEATHLVMWQTQSRKPKTRAQPTNTSDARSLLRWNRPSCNTRQTRQ
jgi:hypothetical protein